jgi:NAD(P)-dependent dehydrogenase (short-subunit alcohol dehydrogenase family)
MAERPKSSFSRKSTADEVVAALDLKGLTIIVTGGATGIGIETCVSLAKAGASEVVLAVRNAEAAEKAIAEIKKRSEKNPKCVVTWSMLDLSELASVRAFAAAWGDRPLNVLINNAGVMACPQTYTKDGFEMQIGTNHFGHFLLTLLLVPALKAGAKQLGRPSRVVCLSSIGHRRSPIMFEDMNFKKTPYDKWQAYGQSKTANALFALAFDKRYKDSGVRAFSVHPGGIFTPLQRHLPKEE